MNEYRANGTNGVVNEGGTEIRMPAHPVTVLPVNSSSENGISWILIIWSTQYRNGLKDENRTVLLERARKQDRFVV